MRYLASAAALALGVFAFSTVASAAVACNGEGDCWRTPHRAYPDRARIHVYDDEWEPGDGYRWREPGIGRGYWRGGVWIGF
jgi:hypothetical protein